MQYLIFVGLSSLLLLFPRAGKQRYLFLCFLLISFAITNQGGSWDYYGYRSYYDCSISNYCDSSFEWSYKLLSRLFHSVWSEYGLYMTMLFYIALSLLIKLKIIFKHSRSIGAALFSYICYAYFCHELTQLRAALSIAFCWIAYDRFVSKKWFSVAIYLSIGVFFHTSAVLAVIGMISYWIKRKHLLICAYISIPIGAAIGVYSYEILSVLPFERMDLYLKAMGSSVFNAPQLALYPMVILFTVTAYILFVPNVDKKWSLLSSNSCLAGVIIYFIFFSVPVIPLRVLEFLSTLYPFLFSSFFYNARVSLKIKYCIFVVYITLFLNLAVKNNTRMDMVFEWHKLDIRYMTDSQREQYEFYLNKRD